MGLEASPPASTKKLHKSGRLKPNIDNPKCLFGLHLNKQGIKGIAIVDGLSEHMSNHNSPYSKGVIKGLLTDMIGCIKELLLEGKNVKVDDLAIFSLGIKNKKGGAPTEEEFTISKNIEGVKFRACATGILLAKSLNLDATLKKATAVTGTSGSSTNAGAPGTPTNGDNNSTQQPTPSGDVPGEGD